MRGGHFALRVRRLLHYPLDFPFMAQANRAGAYARCVAMLAFAAKFKLDELSKELSQVKESLKPRRICSHPDCGRVVHKPRFGLRGACNLHTRRRASLKQ